MSTNEYTAERIRQLHRTVMNASKFTEQSTRRTCTHKEAFTGVFSWNGQTCCCNCCPHNFGPGQNFIEDIDSHITCTQCFTVVRPQVRLPQRTDRDQLDRKRNRAGKQLLKGPKITLTNPDGKNRRVKVG